MQIKLLIEKLQKLYSTYDDEYKSAMGEPEIVIDVFREKAYTRTGAVQYSYGGYAGLTDIVIENTSDGVYKIISAFSEDYEDQNPNKETKKSSSDSCSWPQEWQT